VVENNNNNNNNNKYLRKPPVPSLIHIESGAKFNLLPYVLHLQDTQHYPTTLRWESLYTHFTHIVQKFGTIHPNTGHENRSTALFFF